MWQGRGCQRARGCTFFISAAMSRSEMRIGFESLNGMPFIREMGEGTLLGLGLQVRARARARARVAARIRAALLRTATRGTRDVAVVAER